jgi:hypothetical protein
MAPSGFRFAAYRADTLLGSCHMCATSKLPKSCYVIEMTRIEQSPDAGRPHPSEGTGTKCPDRRKHGIGLFR